MMKKNIANFFGYEIPILKVKKETFLEVEDKAKPTQRFTDSSLMEQGRMGLFVYITPEH